jgi:hypothetical protein
MKAKTITITITIAAKRVTKLPTYPFKNPPSINKIPAPNSEIATKLASSDENPK